MGLLDLTTNLKSLRYGKDRVGGGSSNQPYIQRDLPDSLSEVGRKGGPDFLLRGGTLVPGRVLNDVSRMTQMFFDFKSPNGILFAAKQNVLSLSSTNFKAGEPLKLRTRDTDLTGVDRLRDTIGTFVDNNVSLNQGAYTPLNTIGQVAGGPIGLHLYKQGLNPLNGPDKYLDYIKGLDNNDGNNSRVVGLSREILTSDNVNLFSYKGGPGAILGVGKTNIRRFENTDNGYTNIQIISDKKSVKGKGDTSIIDFRQEPGGSKAISLDYGTKNIEKRVNLGDPGAKPTGKALDGINAFALYKSTGVNNSNDANNDLVKFRIAVIDNNNPKKKTFIHFRAFIDSFQDSYTSQWTDEKMLGRAESFYRYQGFGRQIDMSWTVAAQSQPELIPQYQKLNYLASSLAPDYSETGYMRGNLVELTVGGWCFNQPGIIKNMTLGVPTESPWEIGISNQKSENTENSGTDSLKTSAGVKELPHIVQVTGFTFIPIHNFTPQLQKNTFGGKGGHLSKFGKERYIALNNGDNNNYDNNNYIGDNNHNK